MDGKANAEVEKVLTKILGARVRLSSGGTSRVKTLVVDLGADELERRVRNVFDTPGG